MPAEFGLGIALLVSIPLIVVGIKLIRGGKSPVEEPAPIVPPGFSPPSGVDLAGEAPPPKSAAGPKKSRKGMWIGLALAAFVGQFFACGIAMMRAERRWQADVREIGKAPVREVPPGQTNAADLYLAAVKELPKEYPAGNPQLREAALAAWSDPDSSLAKQLDGLSGALENARKAGSMPFCDFLPADVKRLNAGMDFPQVGGLRTLGLFLALDARRNVASGRHAEALDDVVAGLMLARRLQEQKTPLIVYSLVAALMLDDAYPTAAALLSDPSVPPAVYVGLRDELLHATPSVATAVRAVTFDQGLLEDANALYVERLLWWLPSSSRRNLVEDYRKACRALTTLFATAAERNAPELYEARRAELTAKYPETKSRRAESLGNCLKSRSDFGDCWLMRAGPGALDLAGIIARAQFVDARMQLLFAASGVRLRELQAAAPPASLEELVPEHLPRAAYDPFDGGKPLRIVSDGEGWSVYSLGIDRKDDQGKADAAAAFDADWRKPSSGDVALAAKRWVPPKAPRRPRRNG
ncbi:MAG: hypothetical protein HY925_05085 [Elusimicrobia bacterium]|nr:hypothetical protein [Elusimicrobiota bacterium]